MPNIEPYEGRTLGMALNNAEQQLDKLSTTLQRIDKGTLHEQTGTLQEQQKSFEAACTTILETYAQAGKEAPKSLMEAVKNAARALQQAKLNADLTEISGVVSAVDVFSEAIVEINEYWNRWYNRRMRKVSEPEKKHGGK